MFASSKVLDTVEQISESSKTVITAMIIIPIVAGIALNGILKKLWAMISTFQLINMLSVTSVKVPTNVLNIQTQSQEIINFQPIPKELIFEAFFGKEEKYDESLVLTRPEEEL